MAMQPVHTHLSEDATRTVVLRLPEAPVICRAGFRALSATKGRWPKQGTFSVARCEAFPHDACPDGNIGLSLGLQRQNRSLSVSAAVAIAPRTAFDEEEITPWRLDGILHDTQSLREALADTKSLEQKLQILDQNSRVKAAFGKGRLGCNTTISFALETASDYEVYLLKCLVAAGQEHVLHAPSQWLNQLENAPQNDLDLQVDLGMNGSLKRDHHLERRNLKAGSSQTTSNGVGAMGSMLKGLIQTLHRIELFYNSIGGIIGYQATALELIKRTASEEASHKSRQLNGTSHFDKSTTTRFAAPVGPDLARDKDYALQAAAWGLNALPEMGEIYPLGGAGDRLGLVDEVTGECLPVAMLPYCGRTLLEGLIRDLQAREFLHFKVSGKQDIVPVAIMTSAAKKNHQLVTRLCESKGWFGRQKSNFFLFEQPLIPAVAAEDGRWPISEPLVPILKPGGHGVIWKLASDKGVFDWFFKKGRKAAIVRQISNPIAATDVTLLALAGVGHRHNKKFGFASCERKVGAAEGVNVLIERSTKNGWEYAITCIEYTEFNKLGIPDVPVSPGSMQAQYPANTNVLYVDLPSVEKIASSPSCQSLPGMILNLKKPIVYEDYLGATHRTYAGRVECTMQNVADFLLNKFSSRMKPAQHDSLDTFVVYNQRRKVTSSAKRQRKPADFSLHQTPDGSFLDVTRNAHELLTSCNMEMPMIESIECYLEFGPPFIALLHPAIGPLWSITQQKIHGGGLTRGSELQLEIAEIFWRDVQLDGSLLVLAENIVGSMEECENGEKMLLYGKRCGRCKLERVSIQNKGVDWNSKDNIYWQHKVSRLESTKIVLHGHSEFEAQDVILQGSHTFEVPDGFRMRVMHGSEGIVRDLHPLPVGASASGSWQWQYKLQDRGYVKLDMETVEN
ncbi:hypothetical protein GOP47_0029165 [Adiantum capillus-veneris]|nr:hypothetical protein GOP47_0029165 [Adiantum capillus-veneris]